MPVQVMYENDIIDTVESPLVDELIASRKIKKILRSDGWANVATDPIRGRRRRYEDMERRKTSVPESPISACEALVAEKKQLESDLMEYEERFRRLFKAGEYGIALLDKHEGKITHLNPVLTKLLGISEEECIGKSLKDIGIRLGMGDFQNTLHNLHKSGVLYYDAVEVRAADGHEVDAEVYLVDGPELIQCNICELTEGRQQRQLKLRLISSG